MGSLIQPYSHPLARVSGSLSYTIVWSWPSPDLSVKTSLYLWSPEIFPWIEKTWGYTSFTSIFLISPPYVSLFPSELRRPEFLFQIICASFHARWLFIPTQCHMTCIAYNSWVILPWLIFTFAIWLAQLSQYNVSGNEMYAKSEQMLLLHVSTSSVSFSFSQKKSMSQTRVYSLSLNPGNETMTEEDPQPGATNITWARNKPILLWTTEILRLVVSAANLTKPNTW